MPRIAVDAMGGDRGPAEVVAGALEAASDGLTPIMYGSRGTKTGGLELRETQGVIEMHEKPAEAVRSKPESSLVSAVRAVSEGDADAVVSAGNTGPGLHTLNPYAVAPWVVSVGATDFQGRLAVAERLSPT